MKIMAVREFSSNMNSDDSLPPIPPAGADFLNQGSSNEFRSKLKQI